MPADESTTVVLKVPVAGELDETAELRKTALTERARESVPTLKPATSGAAVVQRERPERVAAPTRQIIDVSEVQTVAGDVVPPTLARPDDPAAAKTERPDTPTTVTLLAPVAGRFALLEETARRAGPSRDTGATPVATAAGP